METRYIKNQSFGEIQFVQKITPDQSLKITKHGEMERDLGDTPYFMIEAQLSFTNYFEATKEEFKEFVDKHKAGLLEFME